MPEESPVTPSDSVAEALPAPVRAFEATKIRSAELFAEMNGDAATPPKRT